MAITPPGGELNLQLPNADNVNRPVTNTVNTPSSFQTMKDRYLAAAKTKPSKCEAPKPNTIVKSDKVKGLIKQFNAKDSEKKEKTERTEKNKLDEQEKPTLNFANFNTSSEDPTPPVNTAQKLFDMMKDTSDHFVPPNHLNNDSNYIFEQSSKSTSIFQSKTDQPRLAGDCFDSKKTVDASVLRGSRPRGHDAVSEDTSTVIYTSAAAQELAEDDVTLVISLNERDNSDIRELESQNIEHRHFKTPDFESPSVEDLKRIGEIIRDNPKGKTFVHCGAGKGRTGTAITAYQIMNGEIKSREDLEDRFKTLEKGGNNVEATCQKEALKTLFNEESAI